jgi:hypothetical protein
MFQNYYLKLGNDTLSYEFITNNSYQGVLNTLDVDSYRNANGDLVKNTVTTKLKVEFETPYLYMNKKNELMNFIRSHFINSLDRSLYITAYVDELDDYRTCKVYLVDPVFKIQQNSPQGIIYQPTRIAFVEF